MTKKEKIIYPVEFRKIINRSALFICNDKEFISRFCCLICNEVMIEPQQTECGCRFCSKCISQFKSEKGHICPGCSDDNINMSKLMNDKALEKEMENLRIKCINESCTKIVMFRELADHLMECVHRKEQCQDCEEWYMYMDRENHLKEWCIKRMVTCEDCGEEMRKEDFDKKHRSHEFEEGGYLCTHWWAPCPYKCSGDVLVNVRTHLEECVYKPIPCPMKEFGCTKIVSQESLDAHIIQDSTRHQQLLLTQVKQLGSENKFLNEYSQRLEDQFQKEVKRITEENLNSEKEITALKRKIETLESDIAKMTSELRQYRASSVKDMVSISGKMTWTVNNIQEKIRCAATSGSDWISSDTFYVSKPGYNMSLKVYPSGDGNGRGNYLSVFFVIHKGLYDESLPWPFQSKVTISMLSHNQSTPDVVVRMKPDLNELCYGRPVSSECNVAAGQPQFIKLSSLLASDAFIQKDSLTFTLHVQPLP